MKKYHKLNYKVDNILCFFYNKHYFFLLDNIEKDGFIYIYNNKKDYEMNIVAIKSDSTNKNSIKIYYEKPIKLIIPKNSINLKFIITCITYNQILQSVNSNNIITYKEIFLSKHSLKKYNELFNPNRNNMYIEKDIIDMYYNQKGLGVNDYINIVNNIIKDGVIVNRKQIDKLNKDGDLITHIMPITPIMPIGNKGYIKVIQEHVNKHCVILVIIIHIGSIELGINIINKFIKTGNNNNENYLFCFNVNEDIDINGTISILIEQFSNYIITSTINYGNDITPSILAYNYINSKYKFDYILKIQTKNKKSWFDGNINILIINAIESILSMFIDNNIDAIGAERFLTNMDDYNMDIIDKYLPYNNLGVIPIISNLSNKQFIKIIDKIILHLPKDFDCNNYKKNNYHIFKDKDISNYKLIKHYLKEGYKKNYSYKNSSNIHFTFFAGTMFFCKKKVFDNMNILYDDIIKASIINNFYYDNVIFKNSSPVHALERLFGYTYNNFAITNYKKPIIYASYICPSCPQENNDNLRDILSKICNKLFVSENTTDIMHQHYLNINKIYSKDSKDSNKYVLLLTNINNNMLDNIINLLHFNTYAFISFGEEYIPYHYFSINKAWIIRYNLINEFIETYKKDDKLFLFNFSNIIINKYKFSCI